MSRSIICSLSREIYFPSLLQVEREVLSQTRDFVFKEATRVIIITPDSNCLPFAVEEY